LQEHANRIANVLVNEMGVVPGNRVLLRSPNSPMLAACWFAVMKVGAIAVTTMPLLRAKEIAYPVQRTKIALALCDHKLADEMEKTKTVASELQRVVYWES
ncbi:AMP-binding protein, partial [Klebsiella pneumoniae]|uniref:AMP-binding protein n=1 Tax=Klebsiella pneumoniae TaxID=573 RepID=UPI0037218602